MPAPAYRQFFRTLLQIGALILIWLVAVTLSSHWMPAIPPTVSGITIALLLLGLGLIKQQWLASGASFLLSEMLLFFIPVVVAVLQYRQVLQGKLLAILLVIIGSTACVMICTALAVDLAWRLESRWRAAREDNP